MPEWARRRARPRTTVRGPRIVHGLLALRPPRIVYLPNQVTISEWTPWHLDPGTLPKSPRMVATMVLRPPFGWTPLAPGTWPLEPGPWHPPKSPRMVPLPVLWNNLRVDYLNRHIIFPQGIIKRRLFIRAFFPSANDQGAGNVVFACGEFFGIGSRDDY